MMTPIYVSKRVCKKLRFYSDYRLLNSNYTYIKLSRIAIHNERYCLSKGKLRTYITKGGNRNTVVYS